MRYLDPKADLTFKKVFGEHPDLVTSFLNALLPLGDDGQIESIEYLPPELVPDNPLKKNSIVDVRCRDQRGRQFIVEMQMIWSSEFKQRVLFNASKAYVRQLEASEDYSLLEPVYSLNLVNEVFEPEVSDYYHNYRIVHEQYTDKVIDGLHLVFVELPKYQPRSFAEGRMKRLWMRFMTEIDEHTREIPDELACDPAISKALATVEESAYDDAQREHYDKFWDIVRTERTLFNSAERKGWKKGHAEGRAEGRAEGIAEGRAEGIAEGRAEGIAEGEAKGRAEGMAEGIEQGKKAAMRDMIKRLEASGMPAEEISSITGMSEKEISQL
ncbi:MAG: Rpn family recombination-promoting nuclease/putative transposase [Bacteroidales bacterium]|nr:Rpn family recombination-promoting nuclease/putative transposase [Bacteroidales bacterium]